MTTMNNSNAATITSARFVIHAIYILPAFVVLLVFGFNVMEAVGVLTLSLLGWHIGLLILNFIQAHRSTARSASNK